MRRYYYDNAPKVWAPQCSRAFCGRNKEYAFLYHVKAEKALGHALPPDAVVHHVDENRGNTSNTNLVICESQEYHRLLHTRMRVLKAGGNPNTDKVCSKCKQAKHRNQFHKWYSRLSHDGLQTTCKSCKIIK